MTTVLFKSLNGSALYGTADPNKVHDVDYFQVYAEDRLYYLGLGRPEGNGRGTQTMTTGVDGVLCDLVAYEVQHFALLAMAGNPAVLPMLWQHDGALGGETVTEQWRMLYRNRYAFASQKAVAAFKGMAYSERKRFNAAVEMGVEVPVPWKSAMHSLRLLAMLAEFLRTGDMKADRRTVDAAVLVGVRTGAYSVERVANMVADAEEEVDYWLERTHLPVKPDRDKVSKVMADVLESLLFAKD